MLENDQDLLNANALHAPPGIGLPRQFCTDKNSKIVKKYCISA